MKTVIISLLVLMTFTASAGAQQSWIGMFAGDPSDPICLADIAPGAPVPVYIVAVVSEYDFPNGITAAEFRVDNLPPNGYEFGGIISETWSSEVTVGELGWDFSIAWVTPQPGPFVAIGQLDFLMLDPDWIGEDHVMKIREGNACECLVMVDELFLTQDVFGGWWTWNCTEYWFCPCIGWTAAQDSDWGAVKALY